MKVKNVLVLVLLMAIVYVLVSMYRKHSWNQAAAKVNVGSIIWSSMRGSNGSQSPVTYRFVYRVAEIKGDTLYLNRLLWDHREDGRAESSIHWTHKEYEQSRKNALTEKPVPIPSRQRQSISMESDKKYAEQKKSPVFYLENDPPILYSKVHFIRDKQLRKFTRDDNSRSKVLIPSYVHENVEYYVE